MITIKRLIYSLFIIASLLVVAGLVKLNSHVKEADASIGNPPVICHHTPSNQITKTFNTWVAYFNHLGQPHSGSTYDTQGACVEPSLTPTPSLEPTPSVEVTPTPIDECDQDECEEPTPTPTETPKEEIRTFTEAGAPQRNCSEIEFTPTITGFTRLSPTSVKFTWTNTDPINDYFVYYGLSADKLEWNTFVQDAHEVTLNDLPANVSIWASVAGTDNVCQGNHSVAVDP